MKLELGSDGRLHKVPEKKELITSSLSEKEEQTIISTAVNERVAFKIPSYVPTDSRDIVLKYLHLAEEDAWNQTIKAWKVSQNPTKESLLMMFKLTLPNHFLTTKVLLPSGNPLFISENTYAVADKVSVENVVNCTGGILEGTHKIGFHILGFTQIDNYDEPISPNSAARVEKYIDQLFDILGEPPKKITLNASTYGKAIANLDVGHNFVEQTLRGKLAAKYPKKFSNSDSVEIDWVRSLSLSS